MVESVVLLEVLISLLDVEAIQADLSAQVNNNSITTSMELSQVLGPHHSGVQE
jgi:hypothetical protein